MGTELRYLLTIILYRERVDDEHVRKMMFRYILKLYLHSLHLQDVGIVATNDVNATE